MYNEGLDPNVTAGLGAMFWFIMIGFYLFFSFTVYKIAQKCNCRDEAWWAFIPILSAFLLIKMADKPIWWFFLCLVPIVNIFAMPDEDVPGMKELLAASEKYLGDKWKPAKAKIHPYYVYGWANAMIFAEGLKKTGKDLTRENFVKAMESIKDLDMKGIMGSVSYSSESHGSPGYARMTKGDVKKMQFIPLTDWKLVQQ